MPQIKDFPDFTPGQYVTLTWDATNFDGSSRLPSGVTIVTSNAKGNLSPLILASRLGKDSNPSANISVQPEIVSGGLEVTAQIGPGVAGESYLVTLNVPSSDGDFVPYWNHINCVAPS